MRKALLLFTFFSLAIGLVSAQNLLTNGDFSEWTSETEPTGWSKAENCSQSEDYHSAPYAVEHTGGTKDLGQTIDIIGGNTYTISLYYKTKVVGDGDDARLWSFWRSEDSNLEDHLDELRFGSSTYLVNDTVNWTKYEVTLEAPATADEFYFEVRTYKGAVTLWDDLSVVLVAGDTIPVVEPVDTIPVVEPVDTMPTTITNGYVQYTMEKADFQLLVDSVNARGLNTVTSDSLVSENYYGASAKYGNFSGFDDSFNETFITSDSAIFVALSQDFVPTKYDGAIVNDTVVVNYSVYDGMTTAYSMELVCTSVDPIVFEQVIEEEAPIEIDPYVVVMSREDYQIIVDTVTVWGLNSHSHPDNSEDYFGASNYNGNFDARDGKYNEKFASAAEAIAEAISTVFLPSVRAEAELGDSIAVTYSYYNGTETLDTTVIYVSTSTEPLIFAAAGTETSIEDLLLDVSIYPNPATQFITCGTSVEKMTVYSITGERVVEVCNVQASQKVDISVLKSGVYFVSVQNNNMTKVEKIIKR